MEPLKIIAITDGRPGHEKQTRGLISALEKITPVTVDVTTVSSDIASDIKAWGNALKSIFHRVSHSLAPCDLVMGTGSHTHPHLISLGYRHRARKVVCMSTPRIITDLFDLCFVPEHDGVAQGKRVFHTMGPPNLSENHGLHQDNRGLILLGGVDTKSHDWDVRAILAMVESVVAKQPYKTWTISTSPRTPESTEKLIFKFASDQANVEFCPFSSTPKGWVEEAYSLNAQVWVTADSMSMVYEALSSGCQVGILPVTWKKRSGKFARSEESMIKKKRVTPLDKWLKDGKMISHGTALNEAERCAGEILKRWWPERLK